MTLVRPLCRSLQHCHHLVAVVRLPIPVLTACPPPQGWWAKQRPRPYRGPTADPSGPAAERAEYFRQLEEQREKARMLKVGVVGIRRRGVCCGAGNAHAHPGLSRAPQENREKVEREAAEEAAGEVNRQFAKKVRPGRSAGTTHAR